MQLMSSAGEAGNGDLCFLFNPIRRVRDKLSAFQVKLVNIRNDDITDGNPKLTLGLIWTIILHFQVCALHPV